MPESFTAAERETTIHVSDADDLVHIWTAQRTVITRLRNHPAFSEVRSGTHGGSHFAVFTCPADKWSPASGIKHTRNVAPETRRRSAERLRALHKASATEDATTMAVASTTSEAS